MSRDINKLFKFLTICEILRKFLLMNSGLPELGASQLPQDRFFSQPWTLFLFFDVENPVCSIQVLLNIKQTYGFHGEWNGRNEIAVNCYVVWSTVQ